ncbi:MAG: hypothetical protein K2L64_03695 [Ureaplasma sp.]|nr:hypothetical protein [Ureaplasma sp.]
MSVTLPNSIASIGDAAFNVESPNGPIPNLVIYVNSNSVENLVKGIFSGTVINLSKN